MALCATSQEWTSHELPTLPGRTHPRRDRHAQRTAVGLNASIRARRAARHLPVRETRLPHLPETGADAEIPDEERDTMNAKTHKSKAPKRRVIRAAKVGSASDAIGKLEPGCEIYCLTFGQFSLIDALCAILEQTGPADVTLATWTAADADLTRAEAMLTAAKIRSMRYIVDRSFETRMPYYCAAMRRLFGDDCIRTTRSHAKWCVIRNEQWNLAIRTSMNMNHNPRLENIEISDDPALADFMTAVADELFAEQEPGVFNGELPGLAGIENVKRQGLASAGKIETRDLRAAFTGPRQT